MVVSGGDDGPFIEDHLFAVSGGDDGPFIEDHLLVVSGGDDGPLVEDHCLFQEVMMDHSLRTIGCFRR